MKINKIVLWSVLLTSCALANEVVNIYSHRHYNSDKQIIKKFQKETGIKVNLVKAKANELMKRLEKEGKKSPADLLITSDVARLYEAKEKGLTQKVESEFLEKTVEKKLRDSQNHWFALTKRARIIAYNKSKIKPSELSSYEDLTTPKWKGRVLIRKSSNIYNQSLLASLIAQEGKDKAEMWARGMVKNFARTPKGSDRDQMKAVAAGIGDVAVVNTYYVGKLLNSKKKNEQMVGKEMGVFFPNQNSTGTHINISGIAMTKYAKNKENAKKFMEYLLKEEAQSLFASSNYEYPVNKNVKPSKLLQSWGEFKESSLPLSELGKHNKEAVIIFDKAGWK